MRVRYRVIVGIVEESNMEVKVMEAVNVMHEVGARGGDR
jgi:hypothetical protein